MFTFYVGQFIEEVVPHIAQRTAVLCGKENYRGPLVGPRDYMQGLKDGLTFAVHHMGYHYDFDHVTEMAQTLLSKVRVTATSFEPSVKDRINEQLDLLRGIRDTRMQAVVAFCYIVGLGAFEPFDVEVATMFANEILLGHIVGYLSIPETEISRFRKAVNAYHASEDPAELMSVLQEHIFMFNK